MADSLLSNLRALDLTDDKGFVCGKVLGELGVDVLKVEPPGGDPARRIPPCFRESDGSESSLYWLAFNTDKRGITLNIKDQRGQALFRQLVEKSDFVIESFSPGYLDGIGLGYKSLEKINPQIIMVSITPYGQRGPHSQYKACELTLSAMAGVLGDVGDPDRPPVKEALNSVYFEGGSAAALGAVMAYNNRETTGAGQQVDVSLQHVSANRDLTGIHIFEFEKQLLKRTGDRGQVGGRRSFRWLWPCKDGHLFWSLRGGHVGVRSNEALSQWLDEEGMVNPFKCVSNIAQLDMGTLSAENRDAFDRALETLFLKHTKAEIFEKTLKTKTQTWPVNNVADVLQNPQLEARNFWQRLTVDDTHTTYQCPRHFFLSNETENYVKQRAPGIGEHNYDVYVKELGLQQTEIRTLKETGVI